MSNLRDAGIFQDFTVWIKDVGKIGESPGFQPPEINIATEEYRGGGMDVAVEIPHGIEKIEFDFDLHTYDPQVFENLGFGVGTLDVPVTFRGYLMTPNGSEQGVIIHTHSLIKSVKTSKVEPGRKVELTVNLVANYYYHEINGRIVTQIDAFNKITFIGGVDRSANARDILAIPYN
jgi:P2 family phage contractile tail tube protein